MNEQMEVAEDELMVIIWEGWLKKKTPRGVIKIWQNRYFRLLGDIFEYYKSDRLGVCSGMIPLQMVSEIRQLPMNKKNGCRFDIVLPTGPGKQRIFSLLAPSADVCEKLVRSIRNMLHQPIDDSNRMDIANVDMKGNFWKKTEEIERRRASSSKKIDVNAQFAGFNIKPRTRKKKPAAATIPEAGTGNEIGPNGEILGPGGLPLSPLGQGRVETDASREERERLASEAKVDEVETPPIRILREAFSIPVGKLYIARDMESKVPYYMHVMNRNVSDDDIGTGTSAAASLAAGGGGSTDKMGKGWQQLMDMKDMWSDVMKINHPFIMRQVSNGESIDRMWLLYSFPTHPSLQYIIASKMKEYQDHLALQALRNPNGILDEGSIQPLNRYAASCNFSAASILTPANHPACLIPPSLMPFLAAEMVLVLDYLHQRNIVCVNLDLKHLFFDDKGHLKLVDFFLMENREGLAGMKRRETREEKYMTPEWHRGESEDYRSDFWRLGLCLYEMLSGVLPAGFFRSFKVPKSSKPLWQRQASLFEERKGDSEEAPSKEDDNASSNVDPLTPAARLKENILSFDPMSALHLPFHPAVPEPLKQFIQSCLQPLVASRLGGAAPTVNHGLPAAASKAAAMTEIMAHAAFRNTVWASLKEEIRSAQLDTRALSRAPELLFDALLYTSTNEGFARNTLSQTVKKEYVIRVLVHSGRNFVTAIKNSAANGTSPPVSPRGGASSPAPAASSSSSPAAAADSKGKSTSGNFYIKVLVDGKVLKTAPSRGTGSSSGSSSSCEWRWEKLMQFKADDSSMETDLLARVMAHDEDSFHDETVGSVAIPMRHVYQMSLELQRMEADAKHKLLQVEEGAISDSPVKNRASSIDESRIAIANAAAAMDSWFSVLDRDGFVVGELRLGFQLKSEKMKGSGDIGSGTSLHGSATAALAPVVSKKRFSGLFGSAFSSEIPREATKAQLSERTQKEIEVAQMMAQMEAEEAKEEAAKTQGEDGDGAPTVTIHRSSMAVSRRVSNSLMALRSSSTISRRASQQIVGGAALVLGKAAEEREEDDDDDEEEEKFLSNASNNIQVLASATPVKASPAASGGSPSNAASPTSAPASPASGTAASGSPAAAGSPAPPPGAIGFTQGRRASIMVNPLPGGTAGPQAGGAAGFLRGLVSKKKMRFQENGFDLDLSYIGDRLIAMGFPSEGSEAAYRNPMPQVQLFFRTYHPNKYKVYNLCSERKYDHAKFTSCENGEVAEFPFDDHNPPHFALLVDFCLDVQGFLTRSMDNIAAIHCKAGKGRTGTVIACFLLYSGLCSHPEAALQYFAVRRTSNGKGVTIPSQIRYVYYFHRYLLGYYDLYRPFLFTGIPLLLTHVRMNGIPKFDLVSGGCDPSFSIFQHERCIFDFSVHKTQPGGFASRSGSNGGLISSSSSGSDDHGDGSNLASREINISGNFVDFKLFVWIRADCKWIFYERDRLGRSQKICWFWLNSTMIADSGKYYVHLTKKEIDGAIKDREAKHFPPNFSIELWFDTQTSQYRNPLMPDGVNSSFALPSSSPAPPHAVTGTSGSGTAAGMNPFLSGGGDTGSIPTLTHLAHKIFSDEAERERAEARLAVDNEMREEDEDEENENEGLDTARERSTAAAKLLLEADKISPFDVELANKNAQLVHQQALHDYFNWQAELEEAAVLFQPEAPPA